MSTTVSYKGQTLTTVSNDTKTLLTEGKYLEDDLTLVDVSGGGSTLITKSISANGTYNASSDSADGYSQVNVTVPNTYTNADEGKVVSDGALVAQTSKNINSNGTHSTVTNNQVVVAVPNSYSAGDEGKVVSNGALVAQTSDTVTTNDTYDTTLINSLTVNVSGGGGGGFTLEEYYSQQYPSGDFTFTGTAMSTTPLLGNTAITKVTAPNLETVDGSFIRNLSSLQYVVLPSCTKVNVAGIGYNANLLGIDWFGGDIASMAFAGNSKLTTMVIRKTSAIVPAGQPNMFNSSKTTAKPIHVYVPSALKATYEAATNWSTWVSDGTVIFHNIEGSLYETKYVDGSIIPTS